MTVSLDLNFRLSGCSNENSDCSQYLDFVSKNYGHLISSTTFTLKSYANLCQDHQIDQLSPSYAMWGVSYLSAIDSICFDLIGICKNLIVNIGCSSNQGKINPNVLPPIVEEINTIWHYLENDVENTFKADLVANDYKKNKSLFLGDDNEGDIYARLPLFLETTIDVMGIINNLIQKLFDLCENEGIFTYTWKILQSLLNFGFDEFNTTNRRKKLVNLINISDDIVQVYEKFLKISNFSKILTLYLNEISLQTIKKFCDDAFFYELNNDPDNTMIWLYASLKNNIYIYAQQFQIENNKRKKSKSEKGFDHLPIDKTKMHNFKLDFCRISISSLLITDGLVNFTSTILCQFYEDLLPQFKDTLGEKDLLKIKQNLTKDFLGKLLKFHRALKNYCFSTKSSEVDTSKKIYPSWKSINISKKLLLTFIFIIESSENSLNAIHDFLERTKKFGTTLNIKNIIEYGKFLNVLKRIRLMFNHLVKDDDIREISVEDSNTLLLLTHQFISMTKCLISNELFSFY